MKAGLLAREGAALRDMADRLEIREVLERYFFGDDRGDAESLNQCLTVDAEARYDMGGAEPVAVKGRAAIVSAIVDATSQRLGVNHLLSNTRIEVEGDRATADSYAIANVVVGDANAGRVLVRGIQYLDEFVRTDEGWRIKTRIHKALWQYEAPATAPGIP